MVLKWKDAIGNWIVLYGSAILNRLRIDKNLADLANKAEARKNLELVDEVTTHYHDKRYIPKIEDLDGKITKNIDEINKTLKNQYVDNNKLERMANDLKTYAMQGVTTATSSATTANKGLMEQLIKEQSERTAADGKQETRINALEKRVSNIYIGPTAPEEPINNFTIWFCTQLNNFSVQVYNGGAWKVLGAPQK